MSRRIRHALRIFIYYKQIPKEQLTTNYKNSLQKYIK